MNKSKIVCRKGMKKRKIIGKLIISLSGVVLLMLHELNMAELDEFYKRTIKED